MKSLHIRERAKSAIRPLAMAGAGIAASGMASAQTFNFPAMGKLNNITADFATILEGSMIDLIIAAAIIGVIGLFIWFFERILTRFTSGQRGR